MPSSYLGLGRDRDPPSNGYLKINFDGATFKDIGKAGLGLVIRKSYGQAIASLLEHAPLPYSYDIVEAMATAKAISFAHELSFTSYIIKGDSEIGIKALQADDISLFPFGHILAFTKPTIDANDNISYYHVRRVGNSVAHNLAKHARHVKGFLVWMKDVSPHLFSVLFTDHG